MKISKSLVKKIRNSIIHSLWMFFLVFVWIRQPIIFDYEFDITKDLNDIEYYSRLQNIKSQKKYKNRFLFINTSHSLEVDSTATYESLTNVRVNRKQLLQCLELLNKNDKKFEIIILDIFIDSVDNEIDHKITNVVNELKKKGKIITINNISELKNGDLEINENVLGRNLSGTTFYPFSNSTAFYKFVYNLKIDKNYHKQVALLAYEQIAHKKANEPFLFDVFYGYENENKLYQNYYIPRIVLGLDNVYFSEDDKNKQNAVYLDIFPDVPEILKKINTSEKNNSIVVIGDFGLGDNHYTTNGPIRGPLIITNTLIALLEGANQLSFLYIFFVVIAFSLVSYYTFYPNVVESYKSTDIKNKYLRSIVNFILEDINYIILFITTLIGVYFFNHYLFILFNTLYIWLLEKGINLYKTKIKKNEI